MNPIISDSAVHFHFSVRNFIDMLSQLPDATAIQVRAANWMATNANIYEDSCPYCRRRCVWKRLNGVKQKSELFFVIELKLGLPFCRCLVKR